MKVQLDREYRVTWRYEDDGNTTLCIIKCENRDDIVGRVKRYYKDTQSRDAARKASLNVALRTPIANGFTKEDRHKFWEVYLNRKPKKIDGDVQTV